MSETTTDCAICDERFSPTDPTQHGGSARQPPHNAVCGARDQLDIGGAPVCGACWAETVAPLAHRIATTDKERAEWEETAREGANQ